MQAHLAACARDVFVDAAGGRHRHCWPRHRALEASRDMVTRCHAVISIRAFRTSLTQAWSQAHPCTQSSACFKGISVRSRHAGLALLTHRLAARRAVCQAFVRYACSTNVHACQAINAARRSKPVSGTSRAHNHARVAPIRGCSGAAISGQAVSHTCAYDREELQHGGAHVM